MYMWCPFEHDVSAMGWYDGSCTPSIVQPLLAVASDKGRIAVYDVRNRNILGKLSRKNDKVKVVTWSPFYRSRFYVGFQSGTLLCCQMDQTLSPSIAVRAEIQMKFPIDYIVSDPQTGTTVAVASKDGRFSIIPSVLKVKTGDEFKTYTLGEGSKVTGVRFYQSHPNFLIFWTDANATLYAIHENIKLLLMETEGVRFMSEPIGDTGRVIVGYDSAVALWENNGERWDRVSITNFVVLKGRVREALMYAELDDKVIVITASHWLTVIEERRGQLFVSQRIRMMPAKPMDWDFRKGSIAFSLSDGQVMATSWTPDAVIRPADVGVSVSMDDLACQGRTALARRRKTERSDRKLVMFEPMAHPGPRKKEDSTFSQLMDSNELEVEIESDDFEQHFDFSSSFVSIPDAKTKGIKRNSQQIREDQKKIWDQLMEDERSPGGTPIAHPPSLKLPVEVSVDLPPTPSPASTSEMQAYCGNSNTLLLSFKVADYPLTHVKWAPGGRLITWAFHQGRNYLHMVDFKRRETTPLLRTQLNAIKVPITDLAFTADRSIFSIIIGGLTALFMTTASKPKQIGSYNFKLPVIGAFSPCENEAVFIDTDSVIHRLRVDKDSNPSVELTGVLKVPKKYGQPTFISYHTQGIIIGTDQGKVFLVYGQGKSDYRTITTITNPVKFVSPCTGNSYVILDNQNNGVVLSKTATPLKGKVKNLKLASDQTFLLKYSGAGRLSVVGVLGTYTPLSPPCVSRCPLMQISTRHEEELSRVEFSTYEEAIKVCRLFGAVFIMRLIQARQYPNRLAARISWLARMIAELPEFNEWSIRIALRVGDTTRARDLLMLTPATSPNYMTNMNRALLCDATVDGQLVEIIANNMISADRVDDAIDTLLAVGAVDRAVEKFISLGQLREAALLLRMRQYDERNHELVKSVATRLIDNRALLLGLLLLSECGFHSEVAGVVTSIVGTEVSSLLSYLEESSNFL